MGFASLNPNGPHPPTPSAWVPPSPAMRERGYSQGEASVLALVDERVLFDPRHHRAQAFADLLDLVLGGAAAHRLEARLAGGVFQHPFAGEAAGLDLGQYLLHLGPDMLVDDPGTARIIAVFRGVRHRVAHVGDAALVD